MTSLHSTRFRLLSPALSSFGEERGNYFVKRFPGVAFADSLTPGYYLSPLQGFGFRLHQTSEWQVPSRQFVLQIWDSCNSSLRICVYLRPSAVKDFSTSRRLNPVQRLFEVGNQVARVFEAQGEAHEVVHDADAFAVFDRVIEERHRGHLGDKAFGPAQARRDEEQFQRGQ